MGELCHCFVRFKSQTSHFCAQLVVVFVRSLLKKLLGSLPYIVLSLSPFERRNAKKSSIKIIVMTKNIKNIFDHHWINYSTSHKFQLLLGLENDLTADLPTDLELALDLGLVLEGDAVVGMVVDEQGILAASPCMALVDLFKESSASLGTNLLSNGTTVRKQVTLVSLLKITLYKLLIYKYMSKYDFSKIFAGIPYHSRIELYHLLNGSQQEQLMPFLTKRERKLLNTYYEFLPGTAGRIMQKHYLVVLQTMTVGEVLGKIRPELSLHKNLSYYVYVVNENMQLIGCVSLKELVLHSEQDNVMDLLKNDLIYLTVDDPKEAVVRKIETSHLVSLPVINNQNQILGIVTHTNAMNMLRKEQSGDTDVLMGIFAREEEQELSYLDISAVNHLKKRIKWILITFLAGTVSQVFLHAKDGFFMNYKLILYISMISDTGGNVGSQVASVVLQALTRGQTGLKDWIRIISKEIEISALLACLLFIAALGKFQLVSSIDPEATRNYQVMFVVAFSLFLQIVCSAFLGAVLPLTAKYLKGDPAIATNPIMNTAVELLGALIYYFVIYWTLHPANVAPAST